MPEPTPINGGAVAPWPAPPSDEVYHGLVGEIVRVLDPHTEADPVGVLVSLLAGFGNAIGSRPHLALDGKRHPLLFWPVLVGPTGTGRKGTALANAGRIFQRALPLWWGGREGSLSTGEGVIQRVRDPIKTPQPIKVRGQSTRYELVQTDPGIEDKRLFVAATEFGGVLQVLGRKESTLGAVIRNAWDGDPLGTVTKTSYLRATGAHITIAGHITPEELRMLLGAQETANGFANRFAWVCVRRSKLLPLGGDPDEGELAMLADLFAEAVKEASEAGRMRLDADAAAIWVALYADLACDEPGAVGQLLSRAEAMIQRIAALYALLDAAPAIGVPHLRAALALWGYGEASVSHVFGATGPAPRQMPVATPTDAQRRGILAALASGPLTRTQILGDVFKRNLGKDELTAVLTGLIEDGLIAATRARPEGGIGASVTTFALTALGRAEVVG